jgi:hypothetical protein
MTAAIVSGGGALRPEKGEFTSNQARNASHTFGVKSITLLAIKPTRKADRADRADQVSPSRLLVAVEQEFIWRRRFPLYW